MENFLFIMLILIIFESTYLLKVTKKINYNQGREDMLNEIYGNGNLTNENYSKYRSTLK